MRARAAITDRERDVLERLCRGESNKTIATAMGMSEQGAKAHVSKLFLKFGVSNRAGLATAAAARLNTALRSDNARLRGENAALRRRRRG